MATLELEKASIPGLIRIRDRMLAQWAPAVRAEFLKAVAEAVGGSTLTAVTEALEARDLAAAEAAIPWDAFATIFDAAVKVALRRALEAAGSLEGKIIVQGLDLAPSAFVFDAFEPAALGWVRREAATLVTSITEGRKLAIRRVLDRVLRGGLTEHDAARLLLDGKVIGLTPRDALAVANLRASQRTSGIRADVADELAARYGRRLLAARADRIAHHELITAHAEGQLASWTQAQRNGLLDSRARMQWAAYNDADEVCLRLDGATAPIGGRFYPGGFRRPPEPHVGCFPGWVRVSAPSGIRAVVARRYSGRLVIVGTAAGHELAVTPNHPVLTHRGWVPAGELHEGCDLIRGSWRKHELTAHVDHEHVPAPIEEIARSYREAPGMASAEMETTAEDFHGDGLDGEVAVVWANRLLRDDAGDPAFREHRQEGQLGRPHGLPVTLASLCRSAALFQRWLASAVRLVSGSYLRHALVGGHPGPFEAFGFALVADPEAHFVQATYDHDPRDLERAGHPQHRTAFGVSLANEIKRNVLAPRWDSLRGPVLDLDAGSVEGVVNAAEGNPKALGNSGTGLAGQVTRGYGLGIEQDSTCTLDRVLFVTSRTFEGQVYNLETRSGRYVAEGIIVSNCRCLLRLLPWGITTGGRAATR